MGGPGGRAECGGDGEGMAEEAWRQADNGAIGAVGGAGCERGAWAWRRGWRGRGRCRRGAWWGRTGREGGDTGAGKAEKAAGGAGR